MRSGSGSWTEYGRYNIDIDAVSAVDPVRDLFVTVDGRGTKTVRVKDLKNPTASAVTVKTAGDVEIQGISAIGFEWDPVGEQFVAWRGGTSVYTLTPPSTNWANEVWVWTRVDAAPTNTVVPTSPNMNSTYSRFRYAPSVNAFLVVNRTSDPVFAFKLTPDSGYSSSPIVGLSASSDSISTGETVTLNWSSAYADSCTASGAWTGNLPTKGTVIVTPAIGANTYTLSCTNAEGITTRTVTIDVIDNGVTTPPTVFLDAEPASVETNGYTMLIWNSTNADECTASGDWSGSKSLLGSESVGPLATSARFDLTCTGPDGSAIDSVFVSVSDGDQSGTIEPDQPGGLNIADVGSGGSGSLDPLWLGIMVLCGFAACKYPNKKNV